MIPMQTRENALNHFEADPDIQDVAEAYSLDMIDFAQQKFGIVLDWSDESLRDVEQIAVALHENYKKSRPAPEQIAPFYRMLGSYIGEVFRRNCEAEWGWVSLDGKRFPGMQHRAGNLFWPWGKAQSRIVNGSADNLWHYYQYLCAPEETLP
jgi:hypothetical protein